MTDRISDLERLNSLRQSGALSEEEFAVEKARLLSGGDSYAAAPDGESGDGAGVDEVAAEPSSRGRTWALLAAGAVVAVGGGFGLYYMVAGGADEPLTVADTPTKDAPKTAEIKPDPAAEFRKLPVGQQMSEAAKLIFGSAKGAVIEADNGKQYGSEKFVEEVNYEPKKLAWASFGPILLSQGDVVDAAHVSSGKIAAHYLKLTDKGLEKGAAYPNAVVTGSFGQVGDWSVSDKFLSSLVIVAEGGGTWQGYTCGWGSITELTPEGPKELASFPLYYSNGGAVEDGEEVESEGKIGNIVRGKSFDIIYSGQSKFTERYFYRGGKYVRENGESKMETC